MLCYEGRSKSDIIPKGRSICYKFLEAEVNVIIIPKGRSKCYNYS